MALSEIDKRLVRMTKFIAAEGISAKWWEEDPDFRYAQVLIEFKNSWNTLYASGIQCRIESYFCPLTKEQRLDLLRPDLIMCQIGRIEHTTGRRMALMVPTGTEVKTVIALYPNDLADALLAASAKYFFNLPYLDLPTTV